MGHEGDEMQRLGCSTLRSKGSVRNVIRAVIREEYRGLFRTFLEREHFSERED